MEIAGTPEEVLAAYDLEIKNLKIKREEINQRLNTLIAAREKAHNAILLSKQEKLSQKDWINSNFQWSDKIKDVLQNVFKLKSFRDKQLACINAILSGQDVILLMPTGGGKSLCYQLPATVTKGVTLVISPLISLMEDQVMALKKLNVNAVMINANTTKDVTKMVHDTLTSGSHSIKLIYVTPERMAKSKRFMSSLQKCYLRNALDRIAIDEVHCCSQWGHDFRPDYKFLGVLKSMFPKTPLIGLTATATSNILVDVQKMLDISGCLVLRASFNRPNLFYEVLPKPSTQDEFVNVLENLLTNKYKGQSGIIYTNTIKECTELGKELRSRGLKVGCYHAELDADVRSQIHMKWHSNTYQVVVATIAFGMGIDKSDVRFVIHHTIPKSIENFYQESGRAGRDDKNADCILFFKLSDIFRLSGMVFSNQTGLTNLYNMAKYCIDAKMCRRSIIAKYFDEIWEPCLCNKMCDHCRFEYTTKEIDIVEHCQNLLKILNHAASLDVRLTPIKLLDSWFHKGDTKLRIKDINPPSFNRETGEQIFCYLLVNDYLKEDFHFTAYSTISYIGRGAKAVLASENNYKIKMLISKRTSSSSETSEKSLKRKTSIKSSKSNKISKIIDLCD